MYSNWKSQNYLQCAGGEAGDEGKAHDNFVYVSSLFTPKNWRHFLAELQAFRHLKICEILDTELLVGFSVVFPALGSHWLLLLRRLSLLLEPGSEAGAGGEVCDEGYEKFWT